VVVDDAMELHWKLVILLNVLLNLRVFVRERGVFFELSLRSQGSSFRIVFPAKGEDLLAEAIMRIGSSSLNSRIVDCYVKQE
ncbi:hypothetical protein HDU76_010254, partial [Blyttiomyces sp. JEL0837]